MVAFVPRVFEKDQRPVIADRCTISKLIELGIIGGDNYFTITIDFVREKFEFVSQRPNIVGFNLLESSKNEKVVGYILHRSQNNFSISSH